MDRQQARDTVKGYLRDYVEKITERDTKAGSNMYKCPLCDSGKHGGRNSNGAFSITKDGQSWKCFSCGRGGDIFDLIAEYEGITEQGAVFNRAYEMYGIKIDDNTDSNIHINTYTNIKKKEKPAEDLTDYYRAAAARRNQTEYIQQRGISEETAAKYWLGYEPHFTQGTGGKEWQALIIPTGKGSYTARNTDKNAEKKDRVRKHGASLLFNSRAFTTAQKPIIIVEGEIDALSIIEVGGEAVGLGSTSNYRQLITLLEKQKPQQPLILALDADEEGQKAEEGIAKELERLQIPFYRQQLYNGHKDANEALLADRQAFTAAIDAAERIEDAAKEAEKEAYLQNNAAGHLQEFINGIAASVNTPAISTGFTQLDKVLDGGLYEGLYICGAISSLGKTTLITQIADQIAAGGHDVLIFSLEMARAELMAKSISRLTLLNTMQNGGSIQDAKTARGITTGARYQNYSQKEKDLIQRAIRAYGEYAEHIYISEGIGDIGAEQVRETVKQHISFTGNTPIVIIDYVQILAPYEIRATDKQNTDKAVLELKRISRDYKTPVIGISSFNRDNYSAKLNMAAFKESGAIEYGADCLIGLQLKGAGGKDFEVDEAKRKIPREIELVILKNRNGATGDIVQYEYYPLFNYFKEV